MTAPIPDLDLAKIRRFCAGRVPPQFADQVRIEPDVRGRSVTILECRPPWREDLVGWSRRRVAQLRYDEVSMGWSLWWADRNGRWHPCDLPRTSRTVDRLLNEIDSDPTAIFWG